MKQKTDTPTPAPASRFTPLRDLVAMLSALVMVLSGAAMSFYSLLAYGDVRTGVLFYVAQALIYAGTLLGVSVYWNGKMRQALQEMELVLSQDAELIAADRAMQEQAAAPGGGAPET